MGSTSPLGRRSPPRATHRVAALAAAIVVVAACGGGGSPPISDAEIGAPMVDPSCVVSAGDGTLPFEVMQALHEGARQQGRADARAAAAAFVDRHTKDGYRLRRITSYSLMAGGLFLVGTLLGALLLGLFARQRPLRYARRLSESLHRELDTVRSLSQRDTAGAEVATRLEGALVSCERAAEEALAQAAELEPVRGSTEVTGRRERAYAAAEDAVTEVERLRFRAEAWHERLLRGEGEEDPAQVFAEIDAAAAEIAPSPEADDGDRE